ncbi:hypothetical protein F5Y18DRAFT_146027 [Xylariaceae sp. FL1019]|nr:hypothetical protein F5Y18DRAFT_146027 [Xylariaceae sp. FL1019]
MTSEELTIHTSCFFNARDKCFEQDTSIEVNIKTGLITRTYKRSQSLPDHDISSKTDNIIDLRRFTVLPGLVDSHTHIFLHAHSETPALNQMRDESYVERIVRATNHATTALMAGYTTYRDLGTEGLRDADVQFRNAINRGIIKGPRMFVASECIASSGGYDIRHENRLPGGLGTSVPRISDPADGPWAVRAAVRRRIASGADVVKFYADYRKRRLRYPAPAWPGAKEIEFPPIDDVLMGDQNVNPDVLLFTEEEIAAMISEAKRSRVPIAAHATSPEAIMMASNAGVTTIEHGFGMNDEGLDVLKANGTIFVPTLAVLDEELRRVDDDDRSPDMDEAFRHIAAYTKAAVDKGIKIACGGDTGAFPHGENVRELELMVEAGIPIPDVIQAATLNGWEACGGDLCGRRFGSLEKGFAADVIALEGELSEDNLDALRRVRFVMKDGRVHKEKL